MAEEPDGGRDAPDWTALAPAVRRVESASGSGSDADADSDTEGDGATGNNAANDSNAANGNNPANGTNAADDNDDETAVDDADEDAGSGDGGAGEDEGDSGDGERGLTPAVRRISSEGEGEGGSADGSDDGGGELGRVDRDGWRDLTPAVERVEGDEGDDGTWEMVANAGGDQVDPAAGGDLGLLPDDEHQADEPDGEAEDDADGTDGLESHGDDEGESDPDDQGNDEGTIDDDALDPRENSVTDADETPAGPDDGLGMNAPDADVEQPLAVHVEEMVKRLAIIIAVASLVSVAVFPVTESLISTIWNHVLPGAEAVDPRVYHPLELVITQLKVASLAGLVIALPVFVYQSYAFMRPGLYRNERRYYLAAVPTSLVLAVLGVLFAYLLVLPYTMDYFQGYTEGTADVAFALGTTFNLILMVMGYLAVVFQIPLFIMLAIMLGVTTRQWLEDRRLLFWAAFAGISFTFGAIDPTGVVPILVALTMIALFEATLALLRWTGN